jgi:AraC family transcriptional regulator, transcriptional activator of pobA
MSHFLTITSICQLHQVLGCAPPQHPLLTIIDYADIPHNPAHYGVKIVTDFYLISLKSPAPAAVQYGRQHYDFAEGTMLFMAPGQVFSVAEPDEPTQYTGWGLYIHPDLLANTPLGRRIRDYTFFGYATHEALHVSDEEHHSMARLVSEIRREYERPIDRHSQGIIVTHVEQLLNYAQRFYGRQFLTRQKVHSDQIGRFETLLHTYLQATDLAERGLPTVEYFASQLHLSADYLTDLLKRETGRTTKEHVQAYLMEQAKQRLLATDLSVNEVAYGLGFTYPQYFNRLFKAHTGLTPKQFRLVD